jgi:hypothetical protein
MTLPLPHAVQRSRLMKLAIGASGFSPKRLSVAASIVRRWRQLIQRTEMDVLTVGGIRTHPEKHHAKRCPRSFAW